jgi:hypothetical protein
MNEDAVKYIPKTLKYTSLRDNMLMFGQYFGELIKTGSLANLVYYDSSQQFHNHIPLNVPREFSVRLLADNKHRFIDPVIISNCENMFTSYHFKDYFQLIDERLKRFNITPFSTERNLTPVYRIEYLDLSENLPGVIYVALKMFEQAPFIRFLNLSTNYNGIPYLGSQELFLNYSSLRYLDLSSNRIEDIQQDVFKNLKLLQELDLSNNKLAKITFNLSHMSMLRYLNLQNNTLETLSIETTSEIDDLESLRINIENNNIRCFCKDLRFVVWIVQNRNKFERFENTKCIFENENITSFGDLDLKQFKSECSPPTYYVLILCLSLAVLTFIIILSCGIVYRFKWNLRYLYYMTKFKLIGQYQPLENREYEKDVFVSYANEDHGFVAKSIIPELEEKGNMSLLIHERDFLAGEYVADNILKAITSTRKTLVVLTKSYIQSKWCMYELNMARIEAADTARNVLCIILKEDVPTKYLPVEIIDIIKKKTYLEFPEDEENMEGVRERLRLTLLVEI